MLCAGRVARRPDRRATQVFAKAHVTFLRVITYLLPRAVPRRHGAPVAMQGVANSDAVGEEAPGRAWPVPAPIASETRSAEERELDHTPNVGRGPDDVNERSVLDVGVRVDPALLGRCADDEEHGLVGPVVADLQRRAGLDDDDRAGRRGRHARAGRRGTSTAFRRRSRTSPPARGRRGASRARRRGSARGSRAPASSSPRSVRRACPSRRRAPASRSCRARRRCSS